MTDWSRSQAQWVGKCHHH